MNLHRTFALCSVAFLLLLNACDDPASAGRDLVVEEGVGPQVVTQRAEAVSSAPLSKVTGNQDRFLTGRVDDPLFGAVSATGYFDFEEEERPESFDEGALEAASLALINDYRYGDTTATVTLELHEMPNEWEAADAPADTTLSAGPLVTSFSFQPTDSLVRVPLPDAWLEDHDEDLRSSDFNEAFHGFRLRPAGANETVVGFTSELSRIRLINESDTARYPLQKVLTGLTRQTSPDPPAGRLAFQDGVGPTLRLELDTEALEASAINRAALRLQVDTETMEQQKPSDFARPQPSSLVLIGVQENGEEVPLGPGALNEEGQYVFAGSLLRLHLQEVLLEGASPFSYYRLSPPFNPQEPIPGTMTINSVLFYGLPDALPSRAPTLLLTVTPL